jgi:hypothetical protein
MEHASGNGSPTSSTSTFSHLDGRHMPQQPTTYRCPALAPAHHLSPQLCCLTRSLARRPRCISATATSASAPASMPSPAPPSLMVWLHESSSMVQWHGSSLTAQVEVCGTDGLEIWHPHCSGSHTCYSMACHRRLIGVHRSPF